MQLLVQIKFYIPLYITKGDIYPGYTCRNNDDTVFTVSLNAPSEAELPPTTSSVSKRKCPPQEPEA